MENTEKTVCKLRVPEFGEKYLCISLSPGQVATEICVPVELVVVGRGKEGNAVICTGATSVLQTNVSYERVLKAIFREEENPHKRNL